MAQFIFVGTNCKRYGQPCKRSPLLHDARVTDAERKGGLLSPAESILKNCNKVDSGCWLWTGYIAKSGYGQITIHRKSWKVHRLSYSVFKSPLIPGFEIDHLCKVRHCVNPAHLEQVTKKENILRSESWSAKNKRKTHCRNGHEYTPDNTLNLKDGARRCKACNRVTGRRNQPHRKREPKFHHWRWRSPKYLITCGAKDGLIDRHTSKVDCKNCLKIMDIRGWDKTRLDAFLASLGADE